MEPNPYESPKTLDSDGIHEPAQQPPRRSDAVAWLAGAALAGAILGSILLAPFVRGPGDPWGRSIGAGLGGFIGLFMGVFICILRAGR